MAARLLILNYHGIVDEEQASSKSYWDVSLAEFKKQLAFLKFNNYNVVSLNEPLTQLSNTSLNIAITFDDANTSDYVHAFPVLQEAGFPATFFIPVKIPGKKIEWNNIRTLSDSGFTIQSHGLSHRELTKVSATQCFAELCDSRKILENEISKPVTQLALPFGSYNNRVLKIAKETGYKTVFTTRFSFNKPVEGSFILHRWSITKNKSFDYYKNILTEKKYAVLTKKIRSTNGFLIKKIIGAQFSNKLNAFLRG